MFIGAVAVTGITLGLASYFSGSGDNYEVPGGSMPDRQETSEFMYGVTVDSISELDSTVGALQRLPLRPTVRLVFDEHMVPGIYHGAVERISGVGDIMGELVDSQYVREYSPAEYKERAEQYVPAFANQVSIWEIGNEVNGEWLLGKNEPRSVVTEKVALAYDVVERHMGAAAITLHYNEGCFDEPEHEMFRWVDEDLPERIKKGIDYVFLSYYEENCEGVQPDWQRVFERLRQDFPTAKLGFGEVGITDANVATKEDYLRRYYNIRPDIPGFVGGYFWWYFQQDMVEPMRRGDTRMLDTLADVMR